MSIIPIEDLGRRLEVGDRVIIRDDLSYKEDYRGQDGEYMGVAYSMEKYRGEVATIIGAHSSNVWRIDLDNRQWMWVSGMFSGVVIENEDLGEIDISDGLSLTSLFGGV